MQVAPRAHRDLAEVGLRDHEHVGDLHDPGLEELQHVARSGLDDDGDRVGHLGDLGLALADADRLDDDDVEGGRERLRGGARGRCQAAEPAGGGRRADEQAGVVGGDGQPRAVAEQRSARAPRRRVDGEHGHAAPAGSPRAHELAEQRRLARAGRAGHADHVRGRLAAERGGGDGAQQRGDLLARGRRAALDEVEHLRRRRQIAVAQARAELASAPGHAAGTLLDDQTRPSTP